MKLYAQHGFGPSDKLARGAEDRLIDGVVLSSRYLTPEAAAKSGEELRSINADFDILLDPEYYAMQQIGMPNAHLGRLAEEGRWPHFVAHRPSEFLAKPSRIQTVLQAAYQAQDMVGCSCFIAPNIYVSRSFDSIESAVALSFITHAKAIAGDMALGAPIFATLCVTRDALMNQHEFEAFLTTLTAIEPKPDGIYLLVSAGSADEQGRSSRSDIIIPEVIGNWMLLNYSLTLNGMRVINGCSDLLSPLLAIAGGEAGASGWWSNLQFFSIGRYIRNEGGGRQPLRRYISTRLLNRVTVNEREAFVALIPEIANGLSMDVCYEGREPSQTEESLQSWQAIASLNEGASSGDMVADLGRFEQRIETAKACYQELVSSGFTERYEANKEYLEALSGGLKYFREKAEI